MQILEFNKEKWVEWILVLCSEICEAGNPLEEQAIVRGNDSKDEFGSDIDWLGLCQSITLWVGNDKG